jgi:hypothetical protein
MTDASKELSFEELERIYGLLAEGIDAAGPEREALFLSKLALILARRIGDPDAVAAAIEAARQDLDLSSI